MICIASLVRNEEWDSSQIEPAATRPQPFCQHFMVTSLSTVLGHLTFTATSATLSKHYPRVAAI